MDQRISPWHVQFKISDWLMSAATKDEAQERVMQILTSCKCKLMQAYLSWSALHHQRRRMRPVVSLTCQTPPKHNNTCKLDWYLNPFDVPKAQSDSGSITVSCGEMTKYPNWSSRLILYDLWMTHSRTSKDGHATHYKRSPCIVIPYSQWDICDYFGKYNMNQPYWKTYLPSKYAACTNKANK